MPKMTEQEYYARRASIAKTAAVVRQEIKQCQGVLARAKRQQEHLEGMLVWIDREMFDADR